MLNHVCLFPTLAFLESQKGRKKRVGHTAGRVATDSLGVLCVVFR